jgi:aspartyl-tRNA(Asn)/glutamyl-tRNA(Gln) amidotransferase subunit B
MEYETVIGLEVHAELATDTKIYCSCENSFGGEENTRCCPNCMGLPGSLPVLNKKVVEYAIMAGLATNCSISSYSKQDRKNYFYPDLPKAYQISQFDIPLCQGGYLDIEVEGKTKRIGITRIHIEEDAGKLMHAPGIGSLVDLNRCGVPLIEIVSEPDMRSPSEAHAYLESIKNILQYIGVSDCKMQEGSLRCDVNVSVRPVGQKELGVRNEMKNMNSFAAAVRAMEYERKRQIKILSEGGVIEQETRRWDDMTGESTTLRSKEDAQDYRYFPEPDLLPIVVDENWINDIKSKLPELPDAKKARYISDFELPEYDAGLISATRKLAEFFEETVKCGAPPKLVANWLMGDISRLLNEDNKTADDISFPPSYLFELISAIQKRIITGATGKKVLEIMYSECKSPNVIIKENNWAAISDEGELAAIVKEVINQNEKSVNDFKAGKDKAIGYLIGQVMKKSRGKANPERAAELLKEELTK